MQEPKADRRIVSKGTYAERIAIKCTFSLLVIISVTFLVYHLVNLFQLWSTRQDTIPVAASVAILCGIILLIMGCNWMIFGAVKIAKNYDTGVPLTRANTADLPASDSLVRASQEPMQAQEGVLLRPASGEAQAGPEGQLLRASVGGQE